MLRQRILGPLGMADTGFGVPDPDDHERIAMPFANEMLPNGTSFADPRVAATFESGGLGLVSTLDDYAIFCRFLLGEEADHHDVLMSDAMLRFACADHIGPATGIVRAPNALLPDGYGFGLGLAVRRHHGEAPVPGSPGELTWTGMAGQMFWVDPQEDLFVVLLQQAPRHRLRHRAILKALVYDALLGRRGLRAQRRARRREDDAD